MKELDKVIQRAEERVKDQKALIEAAKLLRDVWLQIGPYRTGAVEEKTWYEVNDFMGHDDGE
jgi:hypothetical protein